MFKKIETHEVTQIAFHPYAEKEIDRYTLLHSRIFSFF